MKKSINSKRPRTSNEKPYDVYVSDLKTIQTIRKRLNLTRFAYETKNSMIHSITFKIGQIKFQSYKVFSKFIELLSNSPEIENLTLDVFNYSIEKEEFLTLFKRLCDHKSLKSLKFVTSKLPYNKEVFGYMTKYIITSFKSLAYLELDLSKNKFGDDGLVIFGLGIVNLKLLETLKLNFSYSKIEGNGLLALMKNASSLKKLQNLELIFESVNNKGVNFKANYCAFLKLLKRFTTINSIKLNFSYNSLTPEDILKTIRLFLKNEYFDKINKISLDLKSNCSDLSAWKKYDSSLKKSKKNFDSYVEVLNLNLSSNYIEDSSFRHFYDLLINFKGLKYVNLDFSRNLFCHFRSNIFFIFGSVGNNQNLSLEEVTINLEENMRVRSNIFYINAEHIPILENIKTLRLKSNLPESFRIKLVFVDFLKKFGNLERFQLLIPYPEEVEYEKFYIIVEIISTMKKLKFLDLEIVPHNEGREYGEIIDLLNKLENLVYLRLIFHQYDESLNIFRNIFLNLMKLLNICQKLMFITLIARKKDKIDQKFKVELMTVAHHCLDSNVFLKIEGYDEVSFFFNKKKARMLMAFALKCKVKLIYKRQLIMCEILNHFN